MTDKPIYVYVVHPQLPNGEDLPAVKAYFSRENAEDSLKTAIGTWSIYEVALGDLRFVDELIEAAVDAKFELAQAEMLAEFRKEMEAQKVGFWAQLPKYWKLSAHE